MSTREIYNRCYRAWRKYATHEVHDLWRDYRDIYRAAADSFVNNVGGLHGWSNDTRSRQFFIRRMEIRDQKAVQA